MLDVLKAGDSTVIQAKEADDDIVVSLFMRPFRSNNEADQSDEAIFVRNVPLYWTEESVRSVLAQCGRIVSCIQVEKPGKPELCGYKVTFKKNEAAEKALNMPYSKVHLCSSTKIPRKDLAEISKELFPPILDAPKVIRDVDKFLTRFLKQQEENEKQEEELAEPDEEGFVKVTYKGKLKTKPKGKGSIRRQRKHLKKTQEKNLLKFYRCQEHSQNKQLARLEQLQAEKNSRLEMIQKRKFRPF